MISLDLGWPGLWHDRLPRLLQQAPSSSFLSPPCVDCRQSAHNAIRKHHYDGDQQYPDPEVPILRRDARELIACHHENNGTHEPAIESSSAAEDQHDQHISRALKADRLERYVFGGLGEDSTSKSGDCCRNRIGLADVRAAISADRRHTYPILANATQRQPERGVDQSACAQKDQEQYGQRVGVRGVAIEIELEETEHRPD